MRELSSLDAPGFAWEFLRRNPDFHQDRGKLERAARRGMLNQAEVDGFARRLGDDFASATDTTSPNLVLWTGHALPSVIALTALPADLAGPRIQHPLLPVETGVAADVADQLIERRGTVFRVHVHKAGIPAPAVLLPLDQFFEIRAAAAVCLWRGLTGRNPGLNPAALSKARRDRLILALRALDGWQKRASYREIAAALFGFDNVSDRAWKTHELRDRTIRLVRSGFGMMR